MPVNNFFKKNLKTILTIAIALVWLINGLFCKVMNLVPRHQLIVSRILGPDHSRLATIAIGISETLMFIWIISGIRSRLCAITQILVVATMNIIEYRLAPDLLLFGRKNILLATALIIIIYINEFILNKPRAEVPG